MVSDYWLVVSNSKLKIQNYYDFIKISSNRSPSQDYLSWRGGQPNRCRGGEEYRDFWRFLRKFARKGARLGGKFDKI